MLVVVLDTCVLFPPSLRDLLLTLAALGACSVRWSEEILAELHRAVTERYPDIDPKQFDNATIGAMRSAFPDAVVTGWEEVVDQMDNDPADRHVAAAAVTAGADTVVTLNVADFAGRVLSDRHIRVTTPGQLVGAILDDLPERVVDAVREMAARKRNPPMTVDDVLDALARTPDLVGVVARLRELVE